MKTKYKVLLFVLLLSLIAAVPAYQQATRFRSIIVSDSATVGGALAVSGATTLTGAVNQAGLQTLTGGLSVAPNVVIVAPTAIATATPAAYINNAGAHNSLVIAKNATPNFTVGNAGVVTGLVYQNSVSGQKCVNGTQAFTATGVIAHGLSTPVSVQISLAEDVTGDGARTSYTNAAAVVTAKVWTAAATPVAAAAVHTIAYFVCGTP